MFVRSLFWERTVLSLLEKVQELPSNVQAEIADRVGGYIDIADATEDDCTLEQFAEAAVKEREQVIAQGVNSQVDQRWAAPALAEAWCVARLGLDNGRLSRHSAMAVIVAIESFAPHRSNTRTDALSKEANHPASPS